MKRVIRSTEDVKASSSNASNVSEAVSIAQALKFVLDDMAEEDYNKSVARCPNLYSEVQDFIRFN